MEPRLVKIDQNSERFRTFQETARWEVMLGDETIGEVWKTNDSRGRTCWMLDSVILPKSLPQSAVASGYSRTTKSAAVERSSAGT